jgi:hypothetical protein
MSGINYNSYMQHLSTRLHELTGRDEIETALDEIEFLFEVIPPDMQDNAETLITQLRKKLADA